MTINILTFDQLPEAKQRQVIKQCCKDLAEDYKNMGIEQDINRIAIIARDWAEQKHYTESNGKYYIVTIDKIQ